MFALAALSAACHALRVFGYRILRSEAGVHRTCQLWRRRILAYTGHFIGNGGGGVGEVGVEGPLCHEFAVIRCCVVGALV